MKTFEQWLEESGWNAFLLLDCTVNEVKEETIAAMKAAWKAAIYEANHQIENLELKDHGEHIREHNAKRRAKK